jgi:hypothetical protein
MASQKFKGYSDGKANFHGTRHRKNRRVKKSTDTANVKVIEYDLHGWDVEQTKTMLLDRLKKHRNDPNVTLYVMHGRGLHSPNGAKLKELVEEFCRQNSLTTRTDKTSKGGGIYISFGQEYEMKCLTKRFKGLDISPERTVKLRKDKQAKKAARKKEKNARMNKKRKERRNKK